MFTSFKERVRYWDSGNGKQMRPFAPPSPSLPPKWSSDCPQTCAITTHNFAIPRLNFQGYEDGFIDGCKKGLLDGFAAGHREGATIGSKVNGNITHKSLMHSFFKRTVKWELQTKNAKNQYRQTPLAITHPPFNPNTAGLWSYRASAFA